MMSGALNDYVTRLEQQLRQRGIADPRILSEAREHLIDAIEDGRERGLSAADAEHEAFERFGAPEIVAAHILEERDRTGTGVLSVVGALWQHKWWILVPTVLVTVVAGLTSSYFPVRYQAHAIILAIPQRMPDSSVRTATIDDRLGSINEKVRSRTGLEQIIEDLNLYPDRRKTDGMQDIVDDMSDAISVDVLHRDVFRVAFTSDNPRTAMQVTDRLATFFVNESLTDRASVADSAKEFIDSQIEKTREQILAQEKYLETLRAESGGRPLSPAFLIPYETLKESYQALLGRRMDAEIAADLERRQIGEQFRILDAARLPEQPVGPSRLRAALVGAVVGLAIGLVLVVLRRSSNTNTRPPALAEA